MLKASCALPLSRRPQPEDHARSRPQVPSCFSEDLLAVLGSGRPDHRWLIWGPARSGSTFHKDPNATSAWNAVVRGRKRWLLYPPSAQPPGLPCWLSLCVRRLPSRQPRCWQAEVLQCLALGCCLSELAPCPAADATMLLGCPGGGAACGGAAADVDAVSRGLRHACEQNACWWVFSDGHSRCVNFASDGVLEADAEVLLCMGRCTCKRGWCQCGHPGVPDGVVPELLG